MCKPSSSMPSPPALATRHSIGVLPLDCSIDYEEFDRALQSRHSAPILSFDDASSPLSAKVIPESILMQTDARIPGFATRDGHCVYVIEVNTGFSAHVLHKRYSEIRDFRNELLATINEKKHCGHGPCGYLSQLTQVKFPRRRLRLPGWKRDTNIGEERLPVLEQFLQAMLRVYRLTTRRQMRACNNSLCVVVGKIKRFLDVAEPVVYEEAPAVTDCKAVDDSDLPFSFRGLAFSTLCGNMPAPLFPIAEDSDVVVACEGSEPTTVAIY